jgi:DNA-nicking Smr family endonuclease
MANDHRRRREVTPEEVRVWQAVTRDVRPLRGVAVEAGEPPPPPPAPVPQFVPVPARPPPARDLPSLAPGRTPGLDGGTARRLMRGHMVIDDRLDLHGMTQDAAHARLSAVIARAYEAGRRCLLVITGKGRDGDGVLRAQVPRWLNEAPNRGRILGFSFARPQDGGDGALYVLVKRRR